MPDNIKASEIVPAFTIINGDSVDSRAHGRVDVIYSGPIGSKRYTDQLLVTFFKDHSEIWYWDMPFVSNKDLSKPIHSLISDKENDKSLREIESHISKEMFEKFKTQVEAIFKDPNIKF